VGGEYLSASVEGVAARQFVLSRVSPAVVIKEDQCRLPQPPRQLRPATRGRKRTQGTAMLVLSRKVGERILIGDQIAVTIVRVTGGGVRVGIEAPSEMAVLRAEILNEGSPSAERSSSLVSKPHPSSTEYPSAERTSTIYPMPAQSQDDGTVRKPR